MFVKDFLPACDPGRGTDLVCEFGTGMVAKVDGPSTIHIFSREKFTVGYYNDGVMQEVSSIKASIFHTVDFVTSGPVELYMIQANHDIIGPLVRVDAINGQPYPSLIVNRTFFNPLTQFFQWILSPLMLGVLALVVWFIYLAFLFGN